ncbi:hypothetical protein BGX30_009825 [Mortierella sp. GBA39]|nr:hypothetical protein BGX30_009825 [Mortierella sp. GBA39]
MREIILIHVGQVSCGSPTVSRLATPAENSIAWNTDFALDGRPKYVPRAVLVDLEDSVIQDVRHGSYRDLFHLEQMISCREDAANNYTRGYYTIGKELVEQTLDRIRRMSDSCQSLQGFMAFHSLGGGTGNQMVKCVARQGKSMACCLISRGTVSATDIGAATVSIKTNKTVQSVDWCATGLLIDINGAPLPSSPSGEFASVGRAVCGLSNTTAIGEAWSHLGQKFDL